MLLILCGNRVLNYFIRLKTKFMWVTYKLGFFMRKAESGNSPVARNILQLFNDCWTTVHHRSTKRMIAYKEGNNK